MVAKCYTFPVVLGSFLRVLDDIDTEVSFSDDESIIDAWFFFLPRLLEKWSIAMFCSGFIEEGESAEFARYLCEKHGVPENPEEFKEKFASDWLCHHGLKGSPDDEKYLDMPFLAGVSLKKPACGSELSRDGCGEHTGK